MASIIIAWKTFIEIQSMYRKSGNLVKKQLVWIPEGKSVSKNKGPRTLQAFNFCIGNIQFSIKLKIYIQQNSPTSIKKYSKIDKYVKTADCILHNSQYHAEL